MPRRRVVAQRVILPDPKYRDGSVAKFINTLMLNGKKSIAEQVMYGALDVVSRRTKKDPLSVFEEALENVRPQVEVRSRRVGGATYQVPVEVRPGTAQRPRDAVARGRGPAAQREVHGPSASRTS